MWYVYFAIGTNIAITFNEYLLLVYWHLIDYATCKYLNIQNQQIQADMLFSQKLGISFSLLQEALRCGQQKSLQICQHTYDSSKIYCPYIVCTSALFTKSTFFGKMYPIMNIKMIFNNLTFQEKCANIQTHYPHLLYTCLISYVCTPRSNKTPKYI